MKKRCPKCNRKKDLNLFSNDKTHRYGKSSYCKKCAYKKSRAWEIPRLRQIMLRKRYGLSLEEYDLLFKKQKGCCAICKSPYSILDVDHNHTTKKIRGLLCRYCNTALGLLKENMIILKNSINYLRKNI